MTCSRVKLSRKTKQLAGRILRYRDHELKNIGSCLFADREPKNISNHKLTSFAISSSMYSKYVAPNQFRYQSTLPAGSKMKTVQILLFIAAVVLLLLVGKHAAM
jgi:hypothetical protein